jgi:hypothetical protein
MKKRLIIFSLVFFIILCNAALAQENNKDTVSITIFNDVHTLDCFTIEAYQTHKIDASNQIQRYFHLVIDNNSEDTLEIIKNTDYFLPEYHELDENWESSRAVSFCDSLGITLRPYYKMKFIKIAPKGKYEYLINYNQFEKCPNKVGNRFFVKFYYRKTYTNTVFDKDTGVEYYYKDWSDLSLIVIANYSIIKNK